MRDKRNKREEKIEDKAWNFRQIYFVHENFRQLRFIHEDESRPWYNGKAPL